MPTPTSQFLLTSSPLFRFHLSVSISPIPNKNPVQQNMSIVPINNERRTSSDVDPWSLDLWDPFLDFPLFPSSLSNVFTPPGFSAVNSRLDWSETRNAHVFKAALPAFANEDVLVELQDDRVLQISTDSGGFMTKVKLPEDAKIEELKAFMSNGVVTVTVPKVEARRPDVRAIEISGED